MRLIDNAHPHRDLAHGDLARGRLVWRDFRATCAETAELLRQGVTRPVLAVWAVTLLLLSLSLWWPHHDPLLVSAPVDQTVEHGPPELLGWN